MIYDAGPLLHFREINSKVKQSRETEHTWTRVTRYSHSHLWLRPLHPTPLDAVTSPSQARGSGHVTCWRN